MVPTARDAYLFSADIVAVLRKLHNVRDVVWFYQIESFCVIGSNMPLVA